MEQKDSELEKIERQLKELETFKRQKTTTKYLDWNNTIPQIKRAYDAKTFVLIIGVAGIGKTECVREFARVIDRPLYTFNFSEGAREYQFIGRTDIKEDGTTYFLKDVVPQAMEDPKGAILYLDEPNVAHAGVTIRLLGMLDDRREIWYEGQCIKAHPDFFCIASINPLSHAGTAEMSPQLLSRFPIRMTFAYPPTQIEVKIALRDFSEESSAPKKLKRNLTTAIEIAQQLRDMELPYF